MKTEILADAAAVASRGAERIADAAAAAIAERGRFTLAVSGGHTPWQMLTLLAQRKLEWGRVHVFQVDERIAPDGDPDRNLTHLHESLLARAPLPPQNLHPMPVNQADLGAAARAYAENLCHFAGTPPALDLIHLGLGPDGHTASLIPGDAVLRAGEDVAVTGVYQHHRRMTVTYPVLNRARAILWLVTGTDKRDVLPRLLAADPSIPSGKVEQARAVLVADREAAARLPKPTPP